MRLAIVNGRPTVGGVFLNGQGPFRFLLDTGAQANLVEPSIARKLGLAPTSQVAIATVAGITRVAGGRVSEVSLGSVTASNQDFLFSTLGVLHASSPEIQGILGQQFLSGFDYLLDFANRRLVLGETVPDGGSRVGIEMVHGCPAIETSEGRLVLDSGAADTVLFRAPSAVPDGRIRTASGWVSASTVWDLRLRVAGREYRPANALAMPRTALDEFGDGLLPTSLFHAIFISNSGRYAILDPATTNSGHQKT